MIHLEQSGIVQESVNDELCVLNTELECRLEAQTIELHALQDDMKILLHAVGHDLRGPLMNIGGYADLLRDHLGEKLDDKGHQFLERIMTSAEQLDRMLTDIRALSRAKNRPVSAPTEPANPRSNPL